MREKEKPTSIWKIPNIKAEELKKKIVLDIGCGSRPKGYINIDIDRDLLRQKWIPNFILADANKLPFRDECFSVVHAQHVIEHLLNPLQALQEWKRVAETIEIYTPSALDLDETKDHIYTWNLHTFRNMLALVFGNIKIGYTTKPSVVNGRLGKYLPILNLLLAKIGFRRELHTICS